MNTKQAIGYLESKKRSAGAWTICILDEIIKLLERGKEYEKMWEELKKRGSELGLFMEKVPTNFGSSLNEFMEEYKKKYFKDKEDKSELRERIAIMLYKLNDPNRQISREEMKKLLIDLKLELYEREGLIK